MSASLPATQHRQAILMLVLATAFWGVSFPLIKTLVLLNGRLVPDANGWFVTAYTVMPRFLLGALILAAWQWRDFWRCTEKEVLQGVVIGAFSAVGIVLQNDALQFTAASTSAFLTQFYAILIPVYLALRHRRNPGWLIWVCCALVLAGVAVLGNFDWKTLRLGRGEWETLLCSLFFMGQILWLEKKEFADNRPAKLTLVMFSSQAVLFTLLAVVTAPHAQALIVPWTSPAWLGFILALTLFCTVGAYGLMNAWQPKITATEAGLIYCVEPIFGSVMALFLPAWFSLWAAVDYANEHATLSLFVGGGLITLANVLLQLRPPKKA